MIQSKFRGVRFLQNSKPQILFLAAEVAVFALFYSIQLGVLYYYLYLGLSPLLFFLIIWYSDDLKALLKKTLLSRDSIYFYSAIMIWLLLYGITRNGPAYVLETAYYPVLLEEFNFRFLIITVLQRKYTVGQSIVLQALLYALFYGSFLIFLHGGYPGIFTELFILDNFSMALVYGLIYYLRRNFYIPSVLHLSLYLMDVFLPANLGWIAYLSTPV